jgi:hypothetical protein
MVTDPRSLSNAGMNQAAERTKREFDHFLEADATQHVGMVSLMRRIEDLADRVGGPIPCAGEVAGRPSEQRVGVLGHLADQHEARGAVGERIEAALTRIEKLL